MSVMRMLLNELENMALPCLISLPVIILIRFITYKRTGVFRLKREVLITLFFVYLTAVLSATFVPDHNINNGINQPFFHLPDFSDPNLIVYKQSPFGWMLWKIELRDFADIIRNIFGNVLIFAPYGFLLPIIWKDIKAKTVLYGFLLSLFIEFSQLFMDRQTDIYDLLLNTFGVLLGYLVYLTASKVKESKKK